MELALGPGHVDKLMLGFIPLLRWRGAIPNFPVYSDIPKVAFSEVVAKRLSAYPNQLA